MNAPHALRSDRNRPSSPTPSTRPYAPVAYSAGSTNRHRARDFGVGYGSSSGYASARSYTTGNNGPRLFRCV